VPKDAKLPTEPRALVGAGATPARLDAAIASLEQALAGALRAMQQKKAKPYIDQAAEAENKVAEANSRGLGDQHPDVKNWNNLANTMRAKASQILSAEPSQAEQSLDPDVGRLRQELNELRTRRAQAGPAADTVARTASIKPVVEERALVSAQSLSQLKLRYTELEREYERANTEHEALLKKRETTDRLLERERTSAEARYGIITPPTAEAPKMLLNMLKRAGFGGAVGLGLALIAAVCLELRRTLIARGHI
jgi:chromosome segregation ATPase